MLRLMFRLGYSLFVVELILRALIVWLERHSPNYTGFRQITVGVANDMFVAGTYSLVICAFALIPWFRHHRFGRFVLQSFAVFFWIFITGLCIGNTFNVALNGSNLSVQDVKFVNERDMAVLSDSVIASLLSWRASVWFAWALAAWIGCRHMLASLVPMQRRLAGGAAARLIAAFVLGLLITIGTRSYMLSWRKILHAPTETHALVYLIWRVEEEAQYDIGRPDRGIALLRDSLTRMGAKPTNNYNHPLRNLRTPPREWAREELRVLPKNTNVLMITLESFGADVLERHPEYAPFLSKFRQESMDLTRHYTSAFRTAGAVWSLLCGSQNPVPFFVNREFPKTRSMCLPTVLKERGYRTQWVMGCPRGFDNYEEWMTMIGIDHMVGQEDFPKSTERISYGVHDGPMFDRLLAELDTLAPPFFVGALTVSTHHPFSVPTAFREAHPEMADWSPEFQTLYYTDTMLGEFLEKARARSWFANTLLVVVGDHPLWFTQSGGPTDPADLAATRARYQTLALINHPSIPPMIIESTTGHADIPPTIMDLLGGMYESDFTAPGIARATTDPRRVPSQEYPRWQPYTVFGEHRAILRSSVDDTCLTTDEAAPQTRRPCTPEERRIASDIKESQFDTVQWQTMRAQRMILTQ